MSVRSFHWTYPTIQVERNARETPVADLLLKLVIICGISATPQQTKLAVPKPNEISSLRLHRQSLNNSSIHPMQGFLSTAQ